MSIEYKAEGEPWRVAEMTLLAAEFGEEAGTRMVEFHEVASAQARAWTIIRRLFGIGPVFVLADADPDDNRLWGRSDLAHALGLKAGQLAAELDVVRAAWRRRLDAAAAQAPAPVAPEEELDLIPGVESIEEYDFDVTIFEVTSISRTEDDVAKEKVWFTRRVHEWRKMLVEPMAAGTARQALLNELHLRRIEVQLCRWPAGGKEFRDLAKTKQDIESIYQSQLETLDTVFPWKTNIGGKQSFRGVISDVVRAVRDYRATGDNALCDKIRTVAEVEIDLRQSVQAPEARYRWGLQMAIAESIQWIYDPAFRTGLKPQTLARLDSVMRNAVEQARLVVSEDLVDLEKDGVAGEWQDGI